MLNLETEPDTPQERAALVAWHLAHGEGMTTREVAEACGMTEEGARRMMVKLARVLPIYRTDAGIWEVCYLEEMI